jgi:hypothetical protein
LPSCLYLLIGHGAKKFSPHLLGKPDGNPPRSSLPGDLRDDRVPCLVASCRKVAIALIDLLMADSLSTREAGVFNPDQPIQSADSAAALGLRYYAILLRFLSQSTQLFRCCIGRSNVEMKMDVLKANGHVF